MSDKPLEKVLIEKELKIKELMSANVKSQKDYDHLQESLAELQTEVDKIKESHLFVLPWKITEEPNDRCCWEAHIETENGAMIADVRDIKMANYIVNLHNKRLGINNGLDKGK